MTTTNTNTTKTTKREWYAILTKIVEDSNYIDKDGVKAFIAHEVELLDRKKTSNSTLTKLQKENLDIKAEIMEVLNEERKPMTVSELMAKLPYNSQKISALLTQLKKCGRVTNTVVKKVSYYSSNELPTEAENITAE